MIRWIFGILILLVACVTPTATMVRALLIAPGTPGRRYALLSDQPFDNRLSASARKHFFL